MGCHGLAGADDTGCHGLDPCFGGAGGATTAFWAVSLNASRGDDRHEASCWRQQRPSVTHALRRQHECERILHHSERGRAPAKCRRSKSRFWKAPEISYSCTAKVFRARTGLALTRVHVPQQSTSQAKLASEGGYATVTYVWRPVFCVGRRRADAHEAQASEAGPLSEAPSVAHFGGRRAAADLSQHTISKHGHGCQRGFYSGRAAVTVVSRSAAALEPRL